VNGATRHASALEIDQLLRYIVDNVKRAMKWESGLAAALSGHKKWT
jgi:hypothetical protein